MRGYTLEKTPTTQPAAHMKTTTSADDLRIRATLLEEYATRYRDMATMMDKAELEEVKVTGVVTFERVLDQLGSNTRRVQLQIQKEIDEQR